MKQKIYISLYWKCQIIGWSVAALYWQYTGLTGGRFDPVFGLLQFISDVIIYILLTHLYRDFALGNRWQQLDLSSLLKRIVPSVLVLGLIYMMVTVVKIYGLRWLFIAGYSSSFWQFFKTSGPDIFIAGIRLMSIWLLAYHLYQYAQREVSVARENARLATITRDAQLSNLSAQLNPHFLFNSLNNIKALVIENPVSARRAIDLLSELLRSALYSKLGELRTIKEELDLVRDYLELEKLRMEERLQQHIVIEEGLEQCLILPLSIQTLVENAIKHGLDQQENGGLVSITIIKKESFIQITVEHPGKLITPWVGAGVGLKNLRDRLQLEFKGRADFSISQPGELIRAILLIPV